MMKIGTFLQLEDSINQDTSYKCRIIGHEENRILIDYPINQVTNRTEIFPIGTKFKINFNEKNAVFSFPTEIISKGKDKEIPILILSFDKTNLEQIQRREFVRVQTLLDISVHSVDQIFPPFTAVTSDISGGGLAIIIKDEQLVLEPNMLLDIMLVLPLDHKLEYLQLVGKVVRKHNKKEKYYLLSVKFDNIEIHSQEKIIRYCFLKQLEEKRKAYS